jgi:autotransporter translocation and assembly factor TamB
MKAYKKLRLLVVLFVIVLFLAGSGVVLKNIFLSQITKKVQSNFEYSHLHVSVFPPVLILEDVRARAPSPLFSAKRIAVRISYISLLTRERPFNVSIEHPILRLDATSPRTEKENREFGFSLPFSVEAGSIKEGEFYFRGKEVSFQSRKINARFSQKKDEFSFKAEAEQNVLSLDPTRPLVEGKVSLSVNRRGKEIIIKRIEIDGSDFSLKAEGSLLYPLNPDLRLETSLKAKASLVVDFLHLPFDWEGEAEGAGILTIGSEGIAFKGNFSSESLVLNRVFLGKVNGKIDFNEKAAKTVEFNIQKKSMPPELVRIHLADDRIAGEAQGIHLDPIMNYFSLPWPVKSPVWGSFSIENEKLQADAEFREEDFEAESDRFPFDGRIKFNWDGKNEFTFSSQDLSSSFGQIDVEGKAEVGKELDITIQGEIKDVKQARQFTSVILSQNFDFPEIRGKGRSNIHIFGDYDLPQIKADFAFTPGGYDRFDVNSVEGEVELIRDEFFGRFRIDDPFMKGRISLLSSPEGLKVDIRLDRGLVERIFPGFDVDFPLRGEASGNFDVRLKNEDIQLKSTFSSSSLNFADKNLRDISGRLEWQGDALSFSELQFHLHGGVVKGNARVDLRAEDFDIDIQGEAIDLSSLYADVKGNLGFSLKGKGVLGQDLALGNFEIKDLHYIHLQKTEARGQAKLGYSEGRLGLELNGNFLPGENEFNISLALPIPVDDEIFSVDIKGSFNNLDLLLPWKGAKGRVNYLGEVRGGKGSPQIKGAIDFQGSVFPLERFAHALRDYSGLMFVENSKVSFRSLQAELGGGDVQGYGELEFGNGRVENIDLKIEGKNLLLSPLERTRALTDGSLNLIKDSNRFVLEGDLLAHKLFWRREVDEEFTFYSSPYYQPREEPGFFDDLTLNIRLRADDNAWMENSLGTARGRFDLTLTGNVITPVVLGDIEALDGNVYFQDRKFRILSGRLSFINPAAIEPYLSFRGETYVKDYRVTFSLDGPVDRLTPELSSSPPLPPEDVLALLALGESFKRTYSYDTSTLLTTYSLVSFQLSEEAKKRAEGLFVIDRFRIDPFIMGSSPEMAARLTVGKKISRNFFILYSANLRTQREEIARLEWELTDDLSIVGIRNEEGRISIDVKIHKRF